VVGKISTRDAVFLELNKLSSGQSRIGTTEADDKSHLRKIPWTDSGKSWRILSTKLMLGFVEDVDSDDKCL
jgi:hypothetical protein